MARDEEQPVTADILLRAYRMGLFPMAERRDDPRLFWVDPHRRGVLPLGGFHLSRSLRRTILKGDYEVSLNRDFAGVVTACAAREETWINERIFALYGELHDWGFAHSLEVTDREGALIGGVYGVALGQAFFGESMFSRRRDGSKIALATLVAHLGASGFRLFDTQFITDHLASLGAIEISRAAYHEQLAEALRHGADIRALPLPTPQEVVQRIAQTS